MPREGPTVMTRDEYATRKNRESLSKRLGATARRIAARDENRCVYCGATAETSGAHLHLDHVVPRSEGGADEAGNLVLACRSCNSARQALSLREWSRAVAAMVGCDPRTIVRRVERQVAAPLPAVARRRVA